MNEILKSEEAQAAFRGVWEFIPFIYVVFVVAASIALDILDYNGTLVKHYKWKILAISAVLIAVAYLFYPEGQAKIRDIPTLLFGIIVSILVVKYLSYRWKKRKK